ncbi:MAG: putative ABC-type transport system, permease component [Haloplasmataceae bacterium]|jgi:simple sugar transport system permease protein|nr:putative ABC-type transport system, permease component [Haloplasmataceae bacterium]
MFIIPFLQATVVAAIPLLLGTLGGISNERAGHLNLGIEGIMLVGAAGGFIGAFITNSIFLGMLIGGICGLLVSIIYAVLTVTFQANQTVTGLTLTIFGVSLGDLIARDYVGKILSDKFTIFFNNKIKIPLLGDIPFIGDVFFNQDLMVYITYLLVILLTFYFFKTKWGLYLTAVGENPASADSVSINVDLYKYNHILLSGFLCGLGGSYLSVIYMHSWQESITMGIGWISVALVIFSGWNPLKALLGALIFGSLRIVGLYFTLPISQFFIDMLPYLITIIVLVFMSKNKAKNAPPKSLGNAYFREER